MLGQINEWFYHDLAGIQGDPEGPGFQKIIIKPAVVGELTWAWADYRSVRGRITSKWRREGSRLSLGVSIPANTTATVYVPARDASVVTEGDRPAGQSPDVRFLRLAEGCAVYAVGSGDYSFASMLP
jgi:hypothetical protein